MECYCNWDRNLVVIVFAPSSKTVASCRKHVKLVGCNSIAAVNCHLSIVTLAATCCVCHRCSLRKTKKGHGARISRVQCAIFSRRNPSCSTHIGVHVHDIKYDASNVRC